MKQKLDLLESLKLQICDHRGYYWLTETEQRAYDKLLHAQLYLLLTEGEE